MERDRAVAQGVRRTWARFYVSGKMSTEKGKIGNARKRSDWWSKFSEVSGVGREQNNRKRRRDWPQNKIRILPPITKRVQWRCPTFLKRRGEKWRAFQSFPVLFSETRRPHLSQLHAAIWSSHTRALNHGSLRIKGLESVPPGTLGDSNNKAAWLCLEWKRTSRMVLSEFGTSRETWAVRL